MRLQDQNHGCSRSRSVAVYPILLPRKCLDIKFCCLELSHQQATCCWELSRQQVACWQESSRQQNFMTEYFLGNKLNLCVDKKALGNKLLVVKKVLVNKILLSRTFLATKFFGQEPGDLTWQPTTFWKSCLVTGQKICYLENTRS